MELLAMVPRIRQRTNPDCCSQDQSNGNEHLGDLNGQEPGLADNFGDYITKKGVHTLRIGFQNIGGLPTHAGMLKDDILRKGISKFEFDIFGLAETNVDWRVPLEEDKLFYRSRFWWDSLNLVTACNITNPREGTRQYGGTAVFSINSASHHVASKGSDQSSLGRWAWVKYKGKDNQSLRIISAYRPNTSSGPFTVYAQHKQYLQSRDDDRCPRLAFLEDLCKEIEAFKEEGDNIILMLDGNDDMRRGDIHRAFTNCNLHECLLERHGNRAVNTYRRNDKNVPIDGIWASPSIDIKAGGYLAFDEVFPGTDHRTLWIDITYRTAFGHNMAPIVRPQARRLQCKDPRLVSNYICKYEAFINKHQLLQQAQTLEEKRSSISVENLRLEYEELDRLRYQGMEEAQRKCRKL
jgi:hypothetical protein